jgi:HD superfamily phosphohydrolase YqeK
MSDNPGIPARLRPTLPEWARVSTARMQHIQRVAELVDGWALLLGIPESERNRWLKAVWLHDALRDAPDSELQRWGGSVPGPVELRHGPASAGRAKAEGELDRGVLEAVRYHSVGLAEWDMVGRVLYCADFLEPGRRFESAARAELAARFPAEPQRVLFEVARWRLRHLVESGWTIPSPTVRFWNALVVAAAPA